MPHARTDGGALALRDIGDHRARSVACDIGRRVLVLAVDARTDAVELVLHLIELFDGDRAVGCDAIGDSAHAHRCDCTVGQAGAVSSNVVYVELVRSGRVVDADPGVS